VKRLSGSRETVHGELTRVVYCLMTVKHSNIVRFLGYWAPMQPNIIENSGESLHIEQQDMLLCFEYLHNGSLRRHITGMLITSTLLLV
jgi:coatomer subunit beta'